MPSSVSRSSRKRVRFTLGDDTDDSDGNERRVRRKPEESPGSTSSDSEGGDDGCGPLSPVPPAPAGRTGVPSRKQTLNPLAALLKNCASDPSADIMMSQEFSAQLVDAYIACCCDDENDESGDEEEGPLLRRCVEQLSFTAAATVASNRRESSRGLERLFVPLLAAESSQRRKRTVATILLAQQVSRDVEVLRVISESNTRPARKFAKAIGSVDAIAALVAYQGFGQDNTESADDVHTDGEAFLSQSGTSPARPNSAPLAQSTFA